MNIFHAFPGRMADLTGITNTRQDNISRFRCSAWAKML